MRSILGRAVARGSCCLTALLIGLAPAPASAQQRLVLTGATLIDGTGAPPLTGARVVIAAGRFACVSGPEGCPTEPGDSLWDLSGAWLTPGLIDTHVHLPYETESPADLDQAQRLRFALGITTVRDASSLALPTLLAKRPGSADPHAPTPRLLVSGRITPENAGRFNVGLGVPLVDTLIGMGVDAIKLKMPYFDATVAAEIREARAAGVPIYGHTWRDGLAGSFTREAIPLGLSGVSHLTALMVAMQPGDTALRRPQSQAEYWVWEHALWNTVDSARTDSLIGEMTSHGVWLEPTLAWEYYWNQPIEPPPFLAFLGEPPSLRRLVFERGSYRVVRAAWPQSWRRQVQFLRMFHDRGGMLLAGSDDAGPGLGLHAEMRLIGEATGSPMAGLLAATRDAAVALRRPDLGTVEAGKLADLVVHPGDPLEGAAASLRITHVVKGGVVHEEQALLAEFRQRYATASRELWSQRSKRWLPAGLLIAMAPFPIGWLRRKFLRAA